MACPGRLAAGPARFQRAARGVRRASSRSSCPWAGSLPPSQRPPASSWPRPRPTLPSMLARRTAHVDGCTLGVRVRDAGIRGDKPNGSGRAAQNGRRRHAAPPRRHSLRRTSERFRSGDRGPCSGRRAGVSGAAAETLAPDDLRAQRPAGHAHPESQNDAGDRRGIRLELDECGGEPAPRLVDGDGRRAMDGGIAVAVGPAPRDGS
jgi:hypothetical protein